MNKKVLVVIAMFVIIVSAIVALSLDEKIIDPSFEITKSEIINNKISIEYEARSGVNNYFIEITSGDDVIYKTNTNGTTFEIELDNLINGTEYVLSVYADLGNSKMKKCDNDYRFVWNNPKFVQSSVLLNNEDYILNIDAIISDDEYYTIALFINDEVVLRESIDSNEFLISKEFYENKKVMITAALYRGEIRLDEVTLYNGIDPLTDVSITSIEEGENFNLANISFEIAGGDNADYYNVKIYNDKTLVKEFNTIDKVSLLSKNIFELDKKYRIILSAVCGEYSKTSEVNFTINKLEQTSPVYLSNDWNNLHKGSKLSLYCNELDVKILYTIDGSDPLTQGLEYNEPLTIDNNVTLKTVAISSDKKKTNSIIKTYDIKIGEKKDLVVYISPSNQFRNIGIAEVGYTNEMDEMNELSEFIINRLEKYGVTVYRNNPGQKLDDWVQESNEYKVDLHLAIHSNNSINHDEYGIETWINTDTSKSLSLANAIQKNLTSIYSYKTREGYDRGVRYANGALDEVNEKNLEFGILVEIAHHDDIVDAKWIMEHKREIGENIADSILRYYQVIE